jgi:hypothetical protein
MAETDQKMLTIRELTELLIKHNNIHNGLWFVSLEFAFTAGNVPIADSDGNIALRPTGMVSVQRIGIQRSDLPFPLTVNAAETNPEPPSSDPGGRTGGKSTAQRESKNKATA